MTVVLQGYLVANHLPRKDLEDVVLYCKYHCLLSMSAEQRVGQLVIWREVGFFSLIFIFIVTYLFIFIDFLFFWVGGGGGGAFCIFAQLINYWLLKLIVTEISFIDLHCSPTLLSGFFHSHPIVLIDFFSHCRQNLFKSGH